MIYDIDANQTRIFAVSSAVIRKCVTRVLFISERTNVVENKTARNLLIGKIVFIYPRVFVRNTIPRHPSVRFVSRITVGRYYYQFRCFCYYVAMNTHKLVNLWVATN